MTAAASVARLGLGDLDALVPLFDAYRVFYRQQSDLDLARDYLVRRLAAGEYAGFLARDARGRAVGFALMSGSFTSVGLKRIWILNDIYVDPQVRGGGTGAALMEAVEAFARETGAGRMDLFTARSNSTAQSVYRKAGWVEETEFLRFQKKF